MLPLDPHQHRAPPYALPLPFKESWIFVTGFPTMEHLRVPTCLYIHPVYSSIPHSNPPILGILSTHETQSSEAWIERGLCRREAILPETLSTRLGVKIWPFKFAIHRGWIEGRDRLWLNDVRSAYRRCLGSTVDGSRGGIDCDWTMFAALNDGVCDPRWMNEGRDGLWLDNDRC